MTRGSCVGLSLGVEERQAPLASARQAKAVLNRMARIARDPGGAWERFANRMDRRIEYARPAPVYRADPDWPHRLHALIGATSGCATAGEFAPVWRQIEAIVAAKGIRLGPASFYGWNDGDPALGRTLWRLIRHLRPTTVVETGVAHGITTRVILEALERNGHGRLWSVDPPPVEPHRAAEIAIAVDGPAAKRWRLVAGTSRRVLPGLLAELGRIDLFVHDSLHTKRNLCFEVTEAVKFLQPSGVIIIDDIDTNWGFHALQQQHPGARFLVCQSEPVRPDPRRFDGKGLFGVMRATP